MADIIFDCPSCKQPVQADDAWGGQQIECPLCKAPMIVPEAQGTAPQVGAKSLGKQLVSVPGGTNLSAGAIQVPRPSSGRGIPIRNLQQPQAKRQNPVVRYAIIGVVIVAALASGWVAWPYLRPHIPFLNKAADESAAAAPPATDKSAAAAPPEAAPPPPPKEVPMTAPVYTLDVAQAKISEGKVNGSIAGTNFVPDMVRLDQVAGGYVLSMRQGAGQTPDRGLRVNLQLKPTDSPTGQTWTVSQDMRGTPISRVTKIWKTNPKYAAQEKVFFTGFALKLEFGQLTVSNTLPGKIYVALPDKEETVVGGVFNAATTLVGAQETGVQQPAIQNPQTDAQRAEFQKRYGLRPKP
ncbi:MAG: hypothetical protein HY298_16685 [Verrucomicrobia bacterium]|nr:hypothetical protein [Verrucomicrobiota bacterium]